MRYSTTVALSAGSAHTTGDTPREVLGRLSRLPRERSRTVECGFTPFDARLPSAWPRLRRVTRCGIELVSERECCCDQYGAFDVDDDRYTRTSVIQRSQHIRIHQMGRYNTLASPIETDSIPVLYP